MVYAYDQWAQMPVKDLYDTQMMLASVNAAKDMYEKAAKEIDDFREKYGDFYSPIKSQQDWYNQEFNAADKINEIYARGGDPLRNAADRTELMRWINSRQYGKLGEAKRNAENVQKYLESQDKLRQNNLYNDEYNRFLLQRANPAANGNTVSEVIENWGNKPFNITSASAYQDLNEYTGHIFDKLDDSLIESDPKTGLDWFGVSRDQRAEALTSQIGGLLNSDLGQWHYQQSIKNFAAEKGRMPTEAEAIQQFKDDILTATREYEHRNYKENPEYKRQREFYYDNALDAAKSARDYYYYKKKVANTPGYDSDGNPIPKDNTRDKFDYKSSVYNQTVVRASGTTDPRLQGSYMRTNLRNILLTSMTKAGILPKLDVQIDEKDSPTAAWNKIVTAMADPKQITAQMGMYESSNAIKQQQYDVFTDNVIGSLLTSNDRSLFPERIGGVPVEGSRFEGAVWYDPSIHGDLIHAQRDVVSHMDGFIGKRIKTSKPSGNRKYIMIPLSYSIGQLHRDDQIYRQLDMIKIVPVDSNDSIDDNKVSSAPIVFIEDIGQQSYPNPDKNKPVDVSISDRAYSSNVARSVITNSKLKANPKWDFDQQFTDTETGRWFNIPYNND